MEDPQYTNICETIFLLESSNIFEMITKSWAGNEDWNDPRHESVHPDCSNDNGDDDDNDDDVDDDNDDDDDDDDDDNDIVLVFSPPCLIPPLLQFAMAPVQNITVHTVEQNCAHTGALELQTSSGSSVVAALC